MTQSTITRSALLAGIAQRFPFITLLWDCDDTLCLTEKPAFQACCQVINDVLYRKIKNDRVRTAGHWKFTPETLFARFVGYSFRRMITELAAEHKFGFDEGELDQLVLDEKNAVVARFKEGGVEPTSGVNELLGECAPLFGMAVVSSSALDRVLACLDATGQNQHFSAERVFSAAALGSSKPDPKVYLHSLKELKKRASQCVAIEDSKTGVLAARAAGIHVIGYAGSVPEHERAERIRALEEAGCTVVISDWSEFAEALEKVAEVITNA